MDADNRQGAHPGLYEPGEPGHLAARRAAPASGAAAVRSSGARARPAATCSASFRITADCDLDALVVKVEKAGPACHTGAESCFFNAAVRERRALSRVLARRPVRALLEGRKEQLPEGSYTTYLFEKGLDKILKKVGEESTEVIIAGHARDKRETVYEIADLAYHVHGADGGAGHKPWRRCSGELACRHVIDHKVKQEKMT